MKTSVAKLDNDTKIQALQYASVQQPILDNVTSVIQQKKRRDPTNRLDTLTADIAKVSSIFERQSAAWTGTLFEQLINGRNFQGPNETYTWKVMANPPEMLFKLNEKQNSAEAQLIWQVDKLEPLIEAIEFFNTHSKYAAQRHTVIKTIMENVASKITHPQLIKVLGKLQDDESVQDNFTFETYCQWLGMGTQ